MLASTSLLVDDVTGELLEADIFFNSAFPWSTSAGGETGRFDVETIALHEIGHLNGLGHSAIGETEVSGSGRSVLAAEAVMFPLAFGAGNVPAPVAASGRHRRRFRPVSRTPASRTTPVSISGRVTKNGAGLFGAHVVAFNPATGALIGNFTLTPDGNFSIAGLTPGPHVLRVEPLDDADVDSFFEVTAPLDLNFRVGFHDKVVVAPRGGDSGSIEVRVQPK